MSGVLGDLDAKHPDGNKQLDVPTMMKLLMAVYESVHHDEVMTEVTEAVCDAICILGDMRKLAEQVANESGSLDHDIAAEFAQIIARPDNRKLC